jgi:hypothetical protein
MVPGTTVRLISWYEDERGYSCAVAEPGGRLSPPVRA